MKTLFKIMILLLVLGTKPGRSQRVKNDNYKSGKKVGDDWQKAIIPGMGYMVYTPSNGNMYQGVSTSLVFYSLVRDNYSGPSHISTYGSVSIGKNLSNPTSEKVQIYSVGCNLSFEGNQFRNSFIPYFGLEIGHLSVSGQSDTEKFDTGHWTPFLGLDIIHTKDLILTAKGGYLYAMKDFDTWNGVKAEASLKVQLWD